MPDFVDAHNFSANHKEQILKDKKCGCFFCGKIFDPQEITQWISDVSGTAVCPYCSVDAIIGESSGYAITSGFLEQMRKYWF